MKESSLTAKPVNQATINIKEDAIQIVPFIVFKTTRPEPVLTTHFMSQNYTNLPF